MSLSCCSLLHCQLPWLGLLIHGSWRHKRAKAISVTWDIYVKFDGSGFVVMFFATGMLCGAGCLGHAQSGPRAPSYFICGRGRPTPGCCLSPFTPSPLHTPAQIRDVNVLYSGPVQPSKQPKFGHGLQPDSHVRLAWGRTILPALTPM